jgi:hypothetical protein
MKQAVCVEASTTHPECQVPNQRHRLGAPKMSPERSTVALAKRLRAQPAPAGGDAEAVHLALPATIQEAAKHQKWPTFGRVSGASFGHDGRAEPVYVPIAAAAPRMMDKTSVDCQLPSRHQCLGEFG